MKALWRPRELQNSNLNHKALSAKKVIVLRGILRKPPLTKLSLQMWFSNQRGGSESILLVKNRMFLGEEPQWHVGGRGGLSVASRILRNGDSLAPLEMATDEGTCLGSGASDPRGWEICRPVKGEDQENCVLTLTHSLIWLWAGHLAPLSLGLFIS